MKKILSIALIAALVLTSAFAEVTFAGDATLGFGWDLKKETAGFSNGTSAKVSFDFAADKPSKAGEGDLRAEIAAEFDLKIKDTKDNYSASITKANIIYKDIVTVGLLNAGGAFDFAESYWKVGSPAKAVSVVAGADKFAPGFTVTYDKFTVGLGYQHTAGAAAVAPVMGTPDTYTVAAVDSTGVATTIQITGSKYTAGKAEVKETVKAVANVSTAAIEVVEGVNVQGAAQWTYTQVGTADAVNKVYAGAKVAYTSDAFKASVGTDVATQFKENTTTVEFRADATVDPVTAVVYGSTKFKENTTDLNAKVSANIPVEDITASCYVDGRALLAENTRSVEVGASATIDKVTVDASYALAIKAKKNTIKANVTYKADAFTAKAGVGFAFAENSNQLWASASIESSKVVDGATLSLAYAANATAAGDVTTNLLKDQDWGKITASAKVAF